jgi:hypothetical protein
MNPKTINDLDPKLKETYERVMGTSFSPADPAPTPTPAPERPMQTTVVEQPLMNNNLEPIAPMAPMPQPPPMNPVQEMPAMQMSQVPSPFQEAPPPPASVLVNGATTTKKKSILKPLLLAVGGIIFFVAYGVVWAKIFGLF